MQKLFLTIIYCSLVFSLLLSCFSHFVVSKIEEEGQNWVLLVAGSRGYMNYRHQADVYHAWQIFSRKGIPESNIIVMFYDDIAHNYQNPVEGTVINVPDGPNVYEGVPKDYTRKEVTPKNFLKILTGEDMGPGKKTIKSGPNDRIFVYFADHGATGIIAFPSTLLVIEHVLHAKDLIDTIEHMHKKKQYKEMVFYIEACNSGSMFNGLLKDEWNVYATTASNPYESSYSCFDSDLYRTFLADCYSAEFLIGTETYADLSKVTLQEQYLQIKQAVNTSHVCQYGNMNMSNETLATFFGGFNSSNYYARKPSQSIHKAKKIASRDIPEHYYQTRLRMTPNDANIQKEYSMFKQQQLRADVIFGTFYHQLNLQKVINADDSRHNKGDRCYSKKLNPTCNKAAIEAMQKYCGHFNEANLKYTNYITEACNMHSVEKIANKFKEICTFVSL